MITPQTIAQLRAYARQDGLLLALLWIASFASMMYTPETPISQLLLLSTPFFVGWRMVAFRQDALDGAMSYRRGFAYCLHTFFYASLVFAVAQFLYFRYLDGGRFLMQMTQAVDLVKEMASQSPSTGQMDTMAAQMNESLQEMREMKPIDLTFFFMMMNMWIGFISSVVIAFFGRKTKK